MLFVGSAYRIAVDAVRPFAKLFAAGIATIIGFQTVIILGGVMRVIPLTGITLPFVSYGGSSLVANFVALALLLRVSDETTRARAAAPQAQPVGATT
jgi:peptidoglycan glycosyltransferase